MLMDAAVRVQALIVKLTASASNPNNAAAVRRVGR
jgi:hypothetical protein